MTDLAGTFQFLMVQLKATVREQIRYDEGISIPYGSIKSEQIVAWIRQFRRFQFLMVQLKEVSKIPEGQQKKISIPYGSIKSERVVDNSCDFVHFNSLWFN